jgi:hypothetical protein
MNGSASAPAPAHRHGPAFWLAVAVGLATAAVGVGAFGGRHPDLDTRVALALWIVGANLVHDVVVLPVTAAVGLLVTRVLPPPSRAVVQAGLFASAVVLLLAWRPLLDPVHDRNATVHPLDYPRATLTALGIAWLLAVAGWAATSLPSRDGGGHRRQPGSSATRRPPSLPENAT